MSTVTSVRERLVETGRELLETEGLSSLSLRRIAQSAGVSHGAPRHHFPTYEHLLAAIARSGLEDLGAGLTPALAESDRRQALETGAVAYLDFARRRPEMFELIVRHDLLAGRGEHLRELTVPWFAALTQLLDGDSTQALAFWSGLHGFALLLSRHTVDVMPGRPDPAEVVDRLIDALVPHGA